MDKTCIRPTNHNAQKSPSTPSQIVTSSPLHNRLYTQNPLLALGVNASRHHHQQPRPPKTTSRLTSFAFPPQAKSQKPKSQTSRRHHHQHHPERILLFRFFPFLPRRPDGPRNGSLRRSPHRPPLPFLRAVNRRGSRGENGGLERLHRGEAGESASPV